MQTTAEEGRSRKWNSGHAVVAKDRQPCPSGRTWSKTEEFDEQTDELGTMLSGQHSPCCSPGLLYLNNREYIE